MVIFLLVALYANYILFNILLYCHNFTLTSSSCSTSILDLHRYCSECDYEICLTCCQELRKSRKRRTSTSKSGSSLGGPNLVVENGHLFCLKKHRISLNLRRFLKETLISDLKANAEHIMNNFRSLPEKKHDLSKTSGDYNLKASYRETSDDNYLYCRSSKDALTEEALIRFRHHLAKGEPIVIKDVSDKICGLSWEPMVMSRALREHAKSKLQVVDCLTGDVVILFL